MINQSCLHFCFAGFGDLVNNFFFFSAQFCLIGFKTQHSARGTSSLCGVERGAICFQMRYSLLPLFYHVLLCLDGAHVLEHGRERCDGSEHPSDGL